jgi:hypothetical protein
MNEREHKPSTVHIVYKRRRYSIDKKKRGPPPNEKLGSKDLRCFLYNLNTVIYQVALAEYLLETPTT